MATGPVTELPPLGANGSRLVGRPLPAGGTVGVFAPASPYQNRSDLLRGVEWWERNGYRVKLAGGIDARDGYLAGSAEQRAADMIAMFADPAVDVVQALHGGFGSTQLVPELDFDLIRSNPKPFVGASDVTVLHAAIRRFCGLTTFYGPGLTKINAVGTPPLNQESLLRAVTSTEPLGEVPRNPDDQYIRTLAGGKASGEFAGGALWVLCQTIGTPWQIDLKGKILLLEEIGESPWRMDALLTHLRQAGVLEGVAGVVVSEVVDCDWSERRPEYPQTLSIEEVLARHIQPLDVPTIYGLPLGHGKHLFTTPLGAGATLDADRQTLSITEPALASPPEAGAQTTSHA
ncbi:MAG: S66 peptidase family protein [Gaiellaceae bacterium]